MSDRKRKRPDEPADQAAAMGLTIMDNDIAAHANHLITLRFNVAVHRLYLAHVRDILAGGTGPSHANMVSGPAMEETLLMRGRAYGIAVAVVYQAHIQDIEQLIQVTEAARVRVIELRAALVRLLYETEGEPPLKRPRHGDGDDPSGGGGGRSMGV